jgi:di/tricarboxylate transporter
VTAFLMAKGFKRSGLGRRAAEALVAKFGASTQGLAVSLVWRGGAVAGNAVDDGARGGCVDAGGGGSCCVVG